MRSINTVRYVNVHNKLVMDINNYKNLHLKFNTTVTQTDLKFTVHTATDMSNRRLNFNVTPARCSSSRMNAQRETL